MSDAIQEPDETREPDPNTTPAGGEEPTTEELEEPSTEKEVGEEPKAEKPHDPEPSHHAVGIGVIGGPQTIADEVHDDAASPDEE